MDQYRRVLPRDLFNEADLLKCVARLWIVLGGRGWRDGALFPDAWLPQFLVAQDPGSGSISIANLRFEIRGRRYDLTRPLNSRQPWPLYLECDEHDFDPIGVFDEEGELSPEMVAYLEQSDGA